MAAEVCTSGSHWFERACREIHDTRGRTEARVSEALASCTAGERKQIREMYRAMYGEDVVERLHSDHAASPENEVAAALYLWMLDPLERDALVARRALESMDTQYRALVEIYVCRKSSQLFYINRAYQALFKKSLDQDIVSQPSLPYQRILVALSASHKSHRAEVSLHIAQCDAKRLYRAGKAATGAAVHESLVLELLSKRSVSQLRQAFSCYALIYGHSYTKALKREPCVEFDDALSLVVECIRDPTKYFSKVLYMSMKGKIADSGALSRVMISRAEADMGEIKSAFRSKYGVKLRDALRESVQSRDLQNFLVALTECGSLQAPISSLELEEGDVLEKWV